MGYRPIDKIPVGGALYMQVGSWTATPEVMAQDIAHELGHVLGMGHEHQGNDRDRFAQFKCDKVQGYKLAKSAVEANGEDPKKLCEDVRFAFNYRFWAMMDFFKISDGGLDQFGRAATQNLVYGFFSLMHYHSWAFVEDYGACGKDPNECPLAEYKDAQDHSKGVTHWYIPTKPASLDADFVRKFYPWNGVPES